MCDTGLEILLNEAPNKLEELGISITSFYLGNNGITSGGLQCVLTISPGSLSNMKRLDLSKI